MKPNYQTFGTPALKFTLAKVQTMKKRITLDTEHGPLNFAVAIEHDADMGPPWLEHDGHGPVSERTTRNKAPGELVLDDMRHGKLFYDFAAACRQALAEGWDAQPYNEGQETKRQQAAKAARADYENLRRWCASQWHWVGVVVTLLDPEGDETAVSDSLWGIESDAGDYLDQVARELAAEIAASRGTSWQRVTRETFAPIAEERAR